jgi:hypothetical protein
MCSIFARALLLRHSENNSPFTVATLKFPELYSGHKSNYTSFATPNTANTSGKGRRMAEYQPRTRLLAVTSGLSIACTVAFSLRLRCVILRAIKALDTSLVSHGSAPIRCPEAKESIGTIRA